MFRSRKKFPRFIFFNKSFDL